VNANSARMRAVTNSVTQQFLIDTTWRAWVVHSHRTRPVLPPWEWPGALGTGRLWAGADFRDWAPLTPARTLGPRPRAAPKYHSPLLLTLTPTAPTVSRPHGLPRLQSSGVRGLRRGVRGAQSAAYSKCRSGGAGTAGLSAGSATLSTLVL
jgi:hypothetical protein